MNRHLYIYIYILFYKSKDYKLTAIEYYLLLHNIQPKFVKYSNVRFLVSDKQNIFFYRNIFFTEIYFLLSFVIKSIFIYINI